MPNASVKISIGIKSKKMDTDEAFTPTNVVNQAFHAVTDLENYLDVTPTLSTEVYEYILAKRANMWQNGVHISITLENVTHTDRIGKGVIPLPKGHRDVSLTGEETTSALFIEERLNDYISDLKQGAKY